MYLYSTVHSLQFDGSNPSRIFNSVRRLAAVRATRKGACAAAAQQSFMKIVESN